jgi:hypothetical protein
VKKPDIYQKNIFQSTGFLAGDDRPHLAGLQPIVKDRNRRWIQPVDVTGWLATFLESLLPKAIHHFS